MHSSDFEPARIIVLNGASSSGKTSLAKAMQQQSDAPLHHVQLDAFRAMEPPGYWDGWEQRDEIDRQAMMSALCGAMFAAVLQYSRHGQQTILDVALTNPQARRLLVDHLQGWPAYLVGVHCSPAELDRRELQRGDRKIGLAASQLDWLHARMLYDVEIDTIGKPPEDLAIELLAQLRDCPTPTALGRLAALQSAA
ncbi:chloramphenicol phosphotransferase CPT family protein [Ramlibacter sp. XY19]|uniref:chloramphenicol phosphotransferase CPT family protein n=1 Tax=Ramlibacter paludis TaxID=2908000 RepID=UPI0023DA6B8C|nr:chloramphenicol phosphotransferase CPT family protein [Ramlibacter paludis]